MGRNRLSDFHPENEKKVKFNPIANAPHSEFLHFHDLKPLVSSSTLNFEKRVACFTRVKKICQYVFKNDEELTEFLKLNEQTPVKIDCWNQHVLSFYGKLIDDVNIKPLEIFEITEEFLIARRNEIMVSTS